MPKKPVKRCIELIVDEAVTLLVCTFVQMKYHSAINLACLIFSMTLNPMHVHKIMYCFCHYLPTLSLRTNYNHLLALPTYHKASPIHSDTQSPHLTSGPSNHSPYSHLVTHSTTNSDTQSFTSRQPLSSANVRNHPDIQSITLIQSHTPFINSTTWLPPTKPFNLLIVTQQSTHCYVEGSYNINPNH